MVGRILGRTLADGLVAGAAGTTALNAATYLDMAMRGRGTSEMLEKAVEELAHRAGQEIPGSGSEQRGLAMTTTDASMVRLARCAPPPDRRKEHRR